jgi:hypothetical protein
MGALLLVYAGWQLFRWPDFDRTLIGDLFFYPVGLAASGAALAASRRCANQPRLRSAWQLLAVAAIVYLAGDIAQTIYEVQGPLPFPSVADALYLLFYPLMLWGLLRFPAGRRDRGAWVRLMLDLAVVAIAGAMVVTYVVLGPTPRQGGPNALADVVSIAYPVGDMILLVGLGSVLLRQTALSSARALQFMVAGLVFFVAADMVYGYILIHSSYQGGDPVDSLWMIAIALFAVAAAAQSPSEATEVVVEDKGRAASWAPYVAVAVGFGLLIIDHRDVSLVIAGVLLAALVSVRQFLAQDDLVRMQRLASYESLHDALTGLPNRRSLIGDIRAALASSSQDSPRTLAMFDLDGFKTYNDTFGHLAGDQLLARVGAAFTRVCGAVRACVPVGRGRVLCDARRGRGLACGDHDRRRRGVVGDRDRILDRSFLRDRHGPHRGERRERCVAHCRHAHVRDQERTASRDDHRSNTRRAASRHC